jgi:hypothetical protein
VRSNRDAVEQHVDGDVREGPPSPGFHFNVAAAVGEDPATSSQVDFLPENGTNFHYSMQSKVSSA